MLFLFTSPSLPDVKQYRIPFYSVYPCQYLIVTTFYFIVIKSANNDKTYVVYYHLYYSTK